MPWVLVDQIKEFQPITPATKRNIRRYRLIPWTSSCRIGSINSVLRTAARLVGRIPKFGQVTEYIRDELRWLPYPHRIAYRMSALVRHCIEGLAPPYLREFCCSTTLDQHPCCLRSAVQAELIVPCLRTATRQCRAFSVAGPVTWKGLPATLCQIPIDHSIFFSLPSRPFSLTEAGLGARASD